MICRDYASRFRSLPAASYEESIPDKLYDWLPYSASEPQLFVTSPEHLHPEAEILLVQSGCYYFRIKEETSYRAASAGDLLFFRPFELHELAVRRQEGRPSLICINFDYSLLSVPQSKESQALSADLEMGLMYPDTRIPSGAPDAAELRACFSRMKDALDAPGQCRELCFLGALMMLYGILSDHNHLCLDDGKDTSRIRDREFIRKVVAFTDLHYAEPISTADAAAFLNYSEPFFCRTFRRLFHVSFISYCNELRVAHAKELLKTKSVTETALLCGFGNLSYFSLVFKRITRTTPLLYKKQCGQ